MDKKNESVIIANLKKYIEEKGIKIGHIANKCGINLYDKLSGRSAIRVEELEAICEVLDIKVSDLEN